MNGENDAPVAVNDAPIINAPDRIDYWTNSGSGNVTAINHISFADIDAGNEAVTVTLFLDPSQGTLRRRQYLPEMASS